MNKKSIKMTVYASLWKNNQLLASEKRDEAFKRF